MDKDNVKLAIVNEFIAQFNVIGPKVTLDSVCKPIRISKKTIYKYFPSKAGIYDFILKDAQAGVLAAQRVIFNDPNLSTKEKLERILSIHIDWEERIDITKIFQFEESEPEFYHRFIEAYQSNWDFFIRLVDEGKQNGTVKPEVNAELIVAVLSSSMVNLYKGETLTNLGIEYAQAIDEIARMILYGILA